MAGHAELFGQRFERVGEALTVVPPPPHLAKGLSPRIRCARGEEICGLGGGQPRANEYDEHLDGVGEVLDYGIAPLQGTSETTRPAHNDRPDYQCGCDQDRVHGRPPMMRRIQIQPHALSAAPHPTHTQPAGAWTMNAETRGSVVAHHAANRTGSTLSIALDSRA